MNNIANRKLSWGKYKGKYLKDIPNDYLQWILKNKPDIFRGKILVYIKTRLNYPKDKYQVKVINSVGTDGTYIVDAYTRQQAMYNCIREHDILCTQSYHGTEFDIIKI